MINNNSNNLDNQSWDVFYIFQKLTLVLLDFLSKSTIVHKKYINSFINKLLIKNAKNNDLHLFLRVLFWILGISILIYICVVIKQITKQVITISINKFGTIRKNYLIFNKRTKSFFNYFSSTLLLLVNSNKYNIF